MKKEYIIPVANISVAELRNIFLDDGASGEGMGYGGDASEEEITDADTKDRYPFDTQSDKGNDHTFNEFLW